MPDNLVLRGRGLRLSSGGFGVGDMNIITGGSFEVTKPPGGCSININSGDPLTVGAWYHVVGTCDGATARIYVNGVLKNSGPVETDYTGTASGARIGGEVCCGGNNFPGVIDEVRIWNRALSQAEVVVNMTNTLSGSESGLIGYWRFNDGSGTIAADGSTQARHGTLANGPVWTGLGPTNSSAGGLLAQYILNLDLADTLPPAIASDDWPAEGSTNALVIDRFTLGFSEDMSPATITNSVHYDLRAAGADKLFGTVDDERLNHRDIGRQRTDDLEGAQRVLQVIKDTEKEDDVETGQAGRRKMVQIQYAIVDRRPEPLVSQPEIGYVDAVNCRDTRAPALRFKAEPAVPGADVEHANASIRLERQEVTGDIEHNLPLVGQRRRLLHEARNHAFLLPDAGWALYPDTTLVIHPCPPRPRLSASAASRWCAVADIAGVTSRGRRRRR